MLSYRCKINSNIMKGDALMPRKKKDGRFINYYLDRNLFERLERYADDKGQQMTAALERILEEHLDRYEAELASLQNYCPNCHMLVQGTRCPVCDKKWLEPPKSEDYCFLVEKELVWAGVLEDCLRQNEIPYLTQNVLGAGLTAKMGSMMESVKFFVRYGYYEKAKLLDEELFSAGAVAEHEENEI